MKYRVRYGSKELVHVPLNKLLKFESGGERITEKDVQKVVFDELITIFTVVAGEVLQYSTASKGSDSLCKMSCFVSSSGVCDEYVKYDSTEVFNSIEELNAVLAELNSGKKLEDVRLSSYEWNTGECVECKNEIGFEYGGKVCAGYVVKQAIGVSVSPIMVTKERWESYTRMYDSEKDKSASLMSLLMGG